MNLQSILILMALIYLAVTFVVFFMFLMEWNVYKGTDEGKEAAHWALRAPLWPLIGIGMVVAMVAEAWEDTHGR